MGFHIFTFLVKKEKKTKKNQRKKATKQNLKETQNLKTNKQTNKNSKSTETIFQGVKVLVFDCLLVFLPL